jgi:hypothetical protein
MADMMMPFSCDRSRLAGAAAAGIAVTANPSWEANFDMTGMKRIAVVFLSAGALVMLRLSRLLRAIGSA